MAFIMYDLFSFNEISSKPVIINTSHVIPDTWGRGGDGRGGEGRRGEGRGGEERGGEGRGGGGEGRGGEGREGEMKKEVIIDTRQQNDNNNNNNNKFNHFTVFLSLSLSPYLLYASSFLI